jgi:hypothetical protein
VVFCFGGGPGTKNTVMAAVEKQFPIIIVQGSGRMADVIEAYAADKVHASALFEQREEKLRKWMGPKASAADIQGAIKDMETIVEKGELYFYNLQETSPKYNPRYGGYGGAGMGMGAGAHGGAYPHGVAHPSGGGSMRAGEKGQVAGAQSYSSKNNSSSDLLFIIIKALLHNKALSDDSKLLLAIKWNKPDAVKYLLHEKSILRKDSETRPFPELLAYACYNDYAEIASVLLDHGYDKTIIDALIVGQFERSFRHYQQQDQDQDQDNDRKGTYVL